MSCRALYGENGAAEGTRLQYQRAGDFIAKELRVAPELAPKVLFNTSGLTTRECSGSCPAGFLCDSDEYPGSVLVVATAHRVLLLAQTVLLDTLRRSQRAITAPSAPQASTLSASAPSCVTCALLANSKMQKAAHQCVMTVQSDGLAQDMAGAPVRSVLLQRAILQAVHGNVWERGANVANT